MSEDYSHHLLRVCVAQICQTIGWHSIQSGTLDILVDTAKRYIKALGHDTHRFTELAQRTEPNLDDLGEAFRDWKINFPDILEYIKNVSPEECAIKVPKYPAKKESHLNFLKPGSKEVLTRPVHIPEYMPPMLVEQEEEEESKTVPGDQENQSNRDGEIEVVSLSPQETIPVKTQTEFVTPSLAPRVRFSNQATDEDVGRAIRENTSVIMTTSGFISPSRAGKLPDPKLSGDFSDIIQQLIAQELPPAPPKQQYTAPAGPSVKPSVTDQKENELLPIPVLAAPSPLAIASANPDKFDVKVKNRKSGEKRSPGEPRPKQKSGKTHAHKVKEGQPRKHVSKKVLPPEEMRPPVMVPPEMPLPINLATVKRHPEESAETPFIEGKISAEPDKLKMNIFKRISSAKTAAGVKEEKPSLLDLAPVQSSAVVQEPDVKIMPQLVEMPVPKKRQNPNKNTEPKERKKPKTERVSKKQQKMLMNQPPMGFNYNFPPNPPAMPMPMDSKIPGPIFSGQQQQPPPPQQQQQQQLSPQVRPPPPAASTSAQHNLFNLFNFTNSPGLIPPPSGFFGNPFGLPPQHQPPGGLPFPPGAMRGPNPFNMMPLPRFPPLSASIPQNPPPIPDTPSPQPLPDKSQCNVAPLVPESLKLEPLVLNMSSTSTPSVAPKHEPEENPADDEEAKRRKLEKKVKKKKEKKEKTKDKEKKREEKRALKEAMKMSKAKEKREKKKEKERLEREGAFPEETPAIVPKLTLKLGAAHSPNPGSPDGATRKLTIKPIKRDPGFMNETDSGEMPELARISPLVTRPPKPKSPAQTGFGHGIYQHSPTGSGLPPTPGSSGVKAFGGAQMSSPGDHHHHMKSPSSSMMTPIPARGRPRGSGNKQHTTVSSVSPAVPGLTSGFNLSLDTSLLPEKLPNNSVKDADGNQVWICPACGRVDDGTPMIGCDGCDAWYHWVCVGIQVPPDATEDWYCRVCIVKKQEMQVSGAAGIGSDKKKKRKKREKKQQIV